MRTALFAFHFVSFYFVRNLNIRINKFAFNAESIKAINWYGSVEKNSFKLIVYVSGAVESDGSCRPCRSVAPPVHIEQLLSIIFQFLPSCFQLETTALFFFPKSHDEHRKETFQINFYYISSTSVRLIRIFFSSVLLLPWNNLYEKSGSREKKLSFIFDNKQNSKRLEYKWMSVKCFDQASHKKKRRLESWGRPEKKHETKQKLFPNLFFAAIFDKNQQWIRNQIYFLFIVPVVILPYITLAILSPAARPKIRGRTNGVGWLGIFYQQQGILRNQFRLVLSRNFLEFLMTTQAEQRFS